MSHRLSNRRLSSVRTRWSAIGAAIAITLGAGGLLTASAAEPAGSVFVPINPTRVLDTRIPAGLPGPLTNSVPALLDVTGNIPIVNPDQTIGSAVVVPDGATSIVANVTGVTPTTIGYVAIRPGDATGTPSTSSINFTAPGVIVPNSVTVAIPTTGANTGHLNLFFFGITQDATTHLLIDIVGYYTPGTGTGGEPGPTGPAGPTGLQGPVGPQGPDGQPSWEAIPSGTTVTGVASVNSVATAAGQFLGYSVMFPGRASVPLTSAEVNFGAGTGSPDDDPACTGTTAAPTAPPGKVCIYPYGQVNVQDLDGSSLQQLPDHGFYIGWFSTASGALNLWTTWAYTAP